jgi:hydroxymethylglutaryl-CoA lyase
LRDGIRERARCRISLRVAGALAAGEGYVTVPDSVVACECWARDGLQSMPVLVSTDHKVEMIDRVARAGFRKVEVTSFSHPKLLPQFADATEVLRRIDRRPGVSYVVLIPNTRGFDRFEICQKEGSGAEEIILMISSSERHNVLNFRMAHPDAMAEHAAIMKRAHALGVAVIGCAGTVYGCPVKGDITTGEVAKIVRFYLEEGARTIMLGDTTGVANPKLVRERVGELMTLFPHAEFIAHFHDTRGTGIVNSLAMLELGVRHVDCSIGAIGGQPATGAAKYSAGYTGNTCSEDLLALLEEIGVRTGIDIEQLLEAGRRAEEILGQRLRSNVIRSGPVIHGESPPDKEPGAAIRS